MPVVDVHTHMLSGEWLDLLVERSGAYTVEEVLGGSRAVHRAGAPFMTLTPGMFDYDLRIAEMDKAGVDIAIVSLTCPNVFWGDASTSAEAARLINDDMAGAQRRYPDRIRWLTSLPWQYPERAVAELDRSREAGAAGVMTLANIDGQPLTDPRFSDVWRAIDDHGLPVLIHPSLPPGLEQMEMERYNLVATVGFTFDTTLALSRMILDGFFDTYRRLKIIGAHAGGYLPFLIGRLDTWHRSFEPVRETIQQLPSSYLDRFCVDSIAYTREALDLTVSVFGPRSVLYGSDYPHKCGRMDEMLDLVGQLPAETAEQVRGANAVRIFDL
ncbi:MAG: amidohydrolase family protein [Streptosporangiales bacterium]|nr:amidohydrolase family protein [Streptosporangiales bacterium]